ncbi:hypothetical protein [Streptomyces sp. NPDC002889]|uniref:hypothetical protein n=1 Tax=Streptomyces sp. NPDC002889 TaxID=3364669 RepID=UPI0036AAE09D
MRIRPLWPRATSGNSGRDSPVSDGHNGLDTAKTLVSSATFVRGPDRHYDDFEQASHPGPDA